MLEYRQAKCVAFNPIIIYAEVMKKYSLFYVLCLFNNPVRILCYLYPGNIIVHLISISVLKILFWKCIPLFLEKSFCGGKGGVHTTYNRDKMQVKYCHKRYCITSESVIKVFIHFLTKIKKSPCKKYFESQHPLGCKEYIFFIDVKK